MRVAAAPMDVETGAVAANLARACALATRAAAEGAELLALPEMWPTSFVPDATPGDLAASAEAVATLAQHAAELNLAVVGSAFGPVDEEGRPSNRLHLLRDGRIHALHDKEHLFSPTAEHLVFRGGAQAPVSQALGGGAVSGLICYDLRFPSVAQGAVQGGAELLVIVAQWPVDRSAHWEVLLRGRAVEGQCWVLACNRGGVAEVGRRRMRLEFPGEAVLVSPHGEVTARSRDDLLAGEVDWELARGLRRLVPMASDAGRRARRAQPEPGDSSPG